MKTTATVLREMGLPGPFAETEPLERVELELDPPGEGELLIRIRAAGLCHAERLLPGLRARFCRHGPKRREDLDFPP